MKKSVGSIDRVLRLVVAIAAIIGASTLGFTSAWGIVLLVIGAVMAVTSATQYCPLYSILNINTLPRNKKAEQNDVISHG